MMPAGDATAPAQPATSAGPPIPVLPLLRAVRPLDTAESGRPKPAAASSEQAASPGEEPADDTAVIVQGLVFALAPAPVSGDTAATASSAAPAGQTPQGQPAALLLPPAVAAQLMGQALPRQGAQPQDLAGTAEDARTLRVAAHPAPLAGQAEAQFTLASPAAPSAPTSLRLRPVIEAAGIAPTDSTSTSALPSALADSPSASPAALPAATPALGSVPSLGHSFAAVVDRLMAARDAVHADGAAQAVALNLRHAEFGTVSVRFEQRADGLSVALASPDPDFARAVQAAAPSASGKDAGLSSNSGGQGWTASSSGAGAQSQQGQRGTGPHRTEPFATAANPPRPGRASTPAETAPRGIYA